VNSIYILYINQQGDVLFMKKILTMALIVFAMLALAACAGNGSSDVPPPASKRNSAY